MFKGVHSFLISFGIIGWFAMVFLWIAAVIGYVLNLIWIAQFAIAGGVGYALEQADIIKLVCRGVGVFFAPLGAVMGWFA